MLPQNRIERLRKAQDLTLRELTYLLNSEPKGLAQSTVGRWEKGTSGVPDRWKLRLAEVFGVTVPYLMGWTDENDNGNNDGHHIREVA